MNKDPLHKSEKKETSISLVMSADPSRPDSLATLPEELLVRIFSFLDKKSLGQLAIVSKGFKRISEDQRLWQYFFLQTGLTGIFSENIGYKQLVRDIFFLKRKKFFTETYKDCKFAPPHSPQIEKSQATFFSALSTKDPLWEELENLAVKEDKIAFERFFTENNDKLVKDRKIHYVNQLLAFFFHKNEDFFKFLTTYFVNHTTIIKWIFISRESYWIFLKCIEKDIEITLSGKHPIFSAIYAHKSFSFDFWIAFNPECLTKTDEKGRTPIEYALELYRYRTDIEMLIPLIEATYFLNKKLLKNEVTQYFIELGNKLELNEFHKGVQLLNIADFKTDIHMSALEYYLNTSESVQLNRAEIIIKANYEKINTVDARQNTILLRIAATGELSVCDLLLKNGANPNFINEAGNTFLHNLASRDWKSEDVQRLESFLPSVVIGCRTNLSRLNNAGKSPVKIALEKQNTLFLKVLIEQCQSREFITTEDIEKFYLDKSTQTESDDISMRITKP